MIGELSNHLWQSTVFVVCAALLAAALRKNGAHVRHLVWVTASLKSLVPFSLLMSLGGQIAWTRPADSDGKVPTIEAVSIAVDQVAQPFTADEPVVPLSSAPAVDWVPTTLASVWALGFTAILLMRLRGWARVRAAVRTSAPLTLDDVGVAADVNIRASAGLLEPGIVGFWRPVLLLPAGIERRLTSPQLEAVLAHEQCHIRRRDNVTAAIHMVVEAMFWFHPLVWWIGARMVDERERACDEHVLRALGKPEAYAEGILNVCKLYAESPLTCVSGVTGSNLKKRIEAIMVNRVGMRLNFARKLAITLAAILALAAPVVIGMITSPIRTAAQSQDPGGPERFDVVSIKPCHAPGQATPGTPAVGGGRGGGNAPWHAQVSIGRVYWDCVALTTLVDQAYADTEHPLLHMVRDSRPPRNDGLGPNQPKRVRGGPSWAEKDMFTIEVTAPAGLTTPALAGAVRRNLATLPPGLSHALRAALEDRFKVSVRRVTEQQEMHALKIADSGLDKTKVTVPVPGDCVARAEYSERRAAAFANAQPRTVAEMEAADPRICGGLYSSMTGMVFSSATLAQLADDLSRNMDKYVLDQTGIDTKFNFKIRSGDGETMDQRRAAGVAQLGLKLQPVKAPAEHLVIDRAEHPTPNAPAFSGSSRFVLPILASQALAATASQVSGKFEVASIKPCDPSSDVSAGRGGGIGPNYASSPGRITVNCVNAAYLILRAYIMNGAQKPDDPINAWANEASLSDPQNPEQRKIRGPAWIYADKFSIEARAPGGAGDPALWGAMLRALLEERFQLKLHQETEEAQMFALTVAKGGPKFSRGECIPFERGKTNVAAARKDNPGKLFCASMIGDAPEPMMSFLMGGASMAELIRVLRFPVKAPIIDQTGLTGVFNIAFQYGPGEVFSAVQDQLGLKLTPMKGPRGFLVVDRIERPAPDAPNERKRP